MRRLFSALRAIQVFGVRVIPLAILIHPAGAAGAGPRLTLYSESSYAGQTRALEVQSKLEAEVARPTEWLEGYLGFNLNQKVLTADAAGFEPGYASIYPGVRARLPSIIPVYFFAEHWRMMHFGDSCPPTACKSHDSRVGAYAYQWWDVGAAEDPLGAWFSENYSELVYSSRLAHELSLQAWARFGKRIGILRAFYADPFVELDFRRDRLGYRAENTQGAATGLRLVALTSPISLAALGAYQAGTYAADGQRFNEWRGLFVVSGGF